MHQLFSQVLGQRDLSRAGDLFSLDDAEIESCLSQALDHIKAISCSPVFYTKCFCASITLPTLFIYSLFIY